LSELLDDKSKDQNTRWRAAGSLGFTGSIRAVGPLLIHSHDKADMVRWLCAEALGAYAKDSAKARKRLREMAKSDPAWRDNPMTGDREYYVRETAMRAIEQFALSSGGGDSFLTGLPWVDTIEEALERGKDERKLVIVLINPFDQKYFEAGWRGAKEEAEAAHKAAKDPKTTDVGFLKKRAMLVGMMAEPRIIAFLRDRCLLVRMRMCTLKFSPTYAESSINPLKRLGLNPIDVGAPSIVVYAPSGKVVAQASHLAFFCPELMHTICSAALKSAKLPKTEALLSAQKALKKKPRRSNYIAVLDALLDSGELDLVSSVTRNWPGSLVRDVLGLAQAEVYLLKGRIREALEAVEKNAPLKDQKPRRAALLAELRLRLGNAKDALKGAEKASRKDSQWRSRLEFFTALSLDRLGRTAEAQDLFTQIALCEQDDPWSARASLYVASGGPNPREWHPFKAIDLPKILSSTEAARNDTAMDATGDGQAKTAIRRAANYLLERQRPGGEWEGAKLEPLPDGFSIGDAVVIPRTALCVCALEQALPYLDTRTEKRAEKSIESGCKVVRQWSESPGDNIWDVTYALHLEMHFYDSLSVGAKRAAKERIRKIVEVIAILDHDGGWTYAGDIERRHTFNTAPIMLLLAKVKENKLVDVDGMLKQGAAFLESQRLGDASLFHYGTMMQGLTSETQPQGSSMRSPLCELALIEAGVSDGAKLNEGIELFFKHLDDVRSTAKEWESHFEPSVLHDAYHYFFGTWYAAQAIRKVKDDSLRRKYANNLVKAVLLTVELDGGYVDAQITNGRNSSTAMAIMTLVECCK